MTKSTSLRLGNITARSVFNMAAIRFAVVMSEWWLPGMLVFKPDQLPSLKVPVSPITGEAEHAHLRNLNHGLEYWVILMLLQEPGLIFGGKRCKSFDRGIFPHDVLIQVFKAAGQAIQLRRHGSFQRFIEKVNHPALHCTRRFIRGYDLVCQRTETGNLRWAQYDELITGSCPRGRSRGQRTQSGKLQPEPGCDTPCLGQESAAAGPH